jgi:type II secretory pathway pseudopilin PulG
VLIIGILATIAIPQFLGQKDKAKRHDRPDPVRHGE